MLQSSTVTDAGVARTGEAGLREAAWAAPGLGPSSWWLASLTPLGSSLPPYPGLRMLQTSSCAGFCRMNQKPRYLPDPSSHPTPAPLQPQQGPCLSGLPSPDPAGASWSPHLPTVPSVTWLEEKRGPQPFRGTRLGPPEEPPNPPYSQRPSLSPALVLTPGTEPVHFPGRGEEA